MFCERLNGNVGLSDNKYIVTSLLSASLIISIAMGQNTAIIPMRSWETNAAGAGWPSGDTWIDQHNDINEMSNLDLVFLGDSITQSFGGGGRNLGYEPGVTVWNWYYSHRNPGNFGISGDRTQQILWRIDNGNFDNISPKVVVLMCGVNNMLLANNTAEEIAAGIEAICGRLREKVPMTRILLLSTFPSGQMPTHENRIKTNALNAIISDLHDGKNVYYLNISETFLNPDQTANETLMEADFIHLSLAGYYAWAAVIESTLTQLLDEATVVNQAADLDLNNVVKAINFGNVAIDKTVGGIVFKGSVHGTTVDEVYNDASSSTTDIAPSLSGPDAAALQDIYAASVYNSNVVNISVPLTNGDYKVQVLCYEQWSAARDLTLTIEGAVAESLSNVTNAAGALVLGGITTVSDGTLNIQMDTDVANMHVAGVVVSTPSTFIADPTPSDQAEDVDIDQDLSWAVTYVDPSATVLGYDVYLDTGSGLTLVNDYLTQGTSTTYEPGTLIESTQHSWAINTVLSGPTTITGPVWSFTTGDVTPPAAPTNLVATSDSGSISLDWDENVELDLAGYIVSRSTTSGSGYEVIDTVVTDSNYVDRPPGYNLPYYYVVAAKDTGNWRSGPAYGNVSGNSNEASGTGGGGGTLVDEVADLDLTNVIKAINFGPSPAETINGVTFLAAGIGSTVDDVTNNATGGNIPAGAGGTPNIGPTADDNALEQILASSIYNWTDVDLDIDIPLPIGTYKVQLLLYEAWVVTRNSDLKIEDLLVAEEYDMWVGQGEAINSGSVITYILDVTDGTLNVTATAIGSACHIAGLIVSNVAVAGDFEPDGDVDLMDLLYLAQRWLLTGCEAPDWCGGADLDHLGGIVNLPDFAIFAENWLK